VLAAEPAARPASYPADLTDLTDLAGLLGSWVAGKDERRRSVFEHAIARADRKLSDIGRQHGVSRQRVKQLELELAAALSAWLQSPDIATQMAALRRRIQAACPVVAPWAEVAVAVPELAAQVPGTSACLGDLAGFVFPGLHQDGPWAAWRPVTRLRARTVHLALCSVPAGRRAAALAAHQRALRLEGRHWDDWLDYCGLRRFRGWVVRSGAGVAELAEAVLAERGEPMSTAEIAGQIPVPPWKVRDCGLGRDDRFCRTGKGVFGLAEWALPAYRGIREHLIEQIAAAGGQARLGPIADELSSRFGLHQSSVYASARGPEFSRSGGMISLAGPDPAARRQQ
jgi:hypothetical protein